MRSTHLADWPKTIHQTLYEHFCQHWGHFGCWKIPVLGPDLTGNSGFWYPSEHCTFYCAIFYLFYWELDQSSFTIWNANNVATYIKHRYLPDICRFIENMRNYRRENRTIYYLDESFVNCGLTITKGWMDCKVRSAKHAFLTGRTRGPPRTTGRGRRIIIAGVMSSNGFVPDTTLIWESGHKDPLLDYHGEMNHHVFEEWLEKTVLPKLEPNSVLVIGESFYKTKINDNILYSFLCSLLHQFIKHMMVLFTMIIQGRILATTLIYQDSDRNKTIGLHYCSDD